MGVAAAILQAAPWAGTRRSATPSAAAVEQAARPRAAALPLLDDGLPQDEIPAIFRPRFVRAGRARIAPDAYVFGVADQGEAHAYALRLLDGHEIVNDTVGRHRIVATW